ncbi:MAG: hypothetical protein ABI082_01940 [Dokdonella sp.]
MSVEWMRTSHALPSEGEQVEFVLEHRDLAMNGVYNRCVFASRWSEYEPGVVREWRQVAAMDAAAQALCNSLPAHVSAPVECLGAI